MATQQDLAAHLGITQPAVAALVRAGSIPAAARGQYDLDAARLAYCTHLREQAAGRAGKAGAALNLADQRARLAAAQAEDVERKNAVARGELAPLADLRDAGAGVIALIVSQLQHVGMRVARGDAKLRQRIDDEVSQVLTELSMTRIEEAAAHPFQPDPEDSEA